MMKIPITVVGVGAGFGDEDSGPTHHMTEDIALLRSMPHITIYSISDSVMSEAVAEIACQKKTTNYVRLDRLVLPSLYKPGEDFSKGIAVLKQGDVYLVATGSMVHIALEASQELNKNGFNVGVIDAYTIPLHEQNFLKAIKGTKKLITLEEHFLPGGFGSVVCEVLQDNGVMIPVKRIGLGHDKGYCYQYGGRNIIHQYYGIDLNSVVAKTSDFLKS
jgi:transketolase